MAAAARPVGPVPVTAFSDSECEDGDDDDGREEAREGLGFAWTDEERPRLSMHELSPSMHEPML